jgi:hypothetical protein
MPLYRRNPGTVIGPWSADKHVDVVINNNVITVFHYYGVPPNMNKPWFRAKCGGELDPVPIKSKFTAMIRALENKYG